MTNNLLPKVPVHDHTGGILPPLTSPFGFDFIRAKNGMFKRGENGFYKAVMPVPTTVKNSVGGLADLSPEFTFKVGKINSEILARGLSVSRALAVGDRGPLEAMFFVHRAGDNHMERDILSFPNDVKLTSVSVSCLAPDPKALIMEFHSHHEMSAFFSGTDDRDEVEFRIYGVLGKITTFPAARFRIGLYGHFMELRLDQVFHGDLSFIKDAST